MRQLIFNAFLVFITLLAGISVANAQKATLSGTIYDDEGKTVEGAFIYYKSTNNTYSDSRGNYKLTLPARVPVTVTVRHLGYQLSEFSVNLTENEQYSRDIRLIPDIKTLPEVTAETNSTELPRMSITKISPKEVRALPSAFGDFNKILATLPGVVSNSEFTSEYSVRGGNFDENLVYVNGIPIYRPQITRAGQQEGLSFVNPDMVRSVEFSAGGWEARYGDKLSSVLRVNYKKPQAFGSSATIGLLGGRVSLEGATKNERLSFVLGVRHKNSRYLLGTLDVSGEYRPSFTDLQSYITINLTNRKKSSIDRRTTLGILTSFARNRYRIRPTERTTSFGTINQVFNLTVNFEGEEFTGYDTWQGGLKLSHRFTSKFKTDVIFSAVSAREREFFTTEGFYRLCDVDFDPENADPNKCAFEKSAGRSFKNARNLLDINILNIQNNYQYLLGNKSTLDFGIGYSKEIIDDQLSEYSFTDSSDFVFLDYSYQSTANLNTDRFSAYAQHSVDFNKRNRLTYGVRVGYWNFNEQFIFSPSVQYAFKPKWIKEFIFRAAVGVYQQPPFYRELRDFEGDLHPEVKAQTSVHAVLGGERNFTMWTRPFKLTAEVYYKHLFNVIPYDVDDTRIRYYATNDATAYAAGIDMRISGEFIRDAQSWFSLGLMTVKENVGFDDQGFIRRPTDQRINVGVFFQDHFPNNPTLQAFVNLVYGSGLPFGPPNSVNSRTVFKAPSYSRVDLGLSKVFLFNVKNSTPSKIFESIRLTAEVLNLLGADNTFSYTWITDVNGYRYAVPNRLSQRFLNVKVSAEF